MLVWLLTHHLPSGGRAAFKWFVSSELARSASEGPTFSGVLQSLTDHCVHPRNHWLWSQFTSSEYRKWGIEQHLKVLDVGPSLALRAYQILSGKPLKSCTTSLGRSTAERSGGVFCGTLGLPTNEFRAVVFCLWVVFLHCERPHPDASRPTFPEGR